MCVVYVLCRVLCVVCVVMCGVGFVLIIVLHDICVGRHVLVGCLVVCVV